jgi:hypothetical protein
MMSSYQIREQKLNALPGAGVPRNLRTEGSLYIDVKMQEESFVEALHPLCNDYFGKRIYSMMLRIYEGKAKKRCSVLLVLHRVQSMLSSGR